MGEQNFERAVRVLEPLELTPETEAQWMELSELALANNQVYDAGVLHSGRACEHATTLPHGTHPCRSRQCGRPLTHACACAFSSLFLSLSHTHTHTHTHNRCSRSS